MKSSVPVAVVIVNWNSAGDLDRCLRALAAQTVRPHKILVVDNASSDASLAAVEAHFPLCDLVCLNENTGFAAANNFAVRVCAGCEWIAFLNPDAFAESNWLQSLYARATREKGFSFFGSHMIRYGSEAVLDGTGDSYHVSGLAWRRDHGAPVSRTYRSTGEVFAPCAAAALIRRDLFLSAGGFDEDHHSYFEDVDLAFRLRLLGRRSLYVAEARVHHVGSGSTHRYSAYAVYHGNRNLVWTYLKNMPTPLIWVYLPQHLLANAAALFWYTLRKQGKAVFRAKWDALCGCRSMWTKRKRIQAQRRVPVRAIRQAMRKGVALPYCRRKRRC